MWLTPWWWPPWFHVPKHSLPYMRPCTTTQASTPHNLLLAQVKFIAFAERIFLELFCVVSFYFPFHFICITSIPHSLRHFTFDARAKTSTYSNNRKIIIDKIQSNVLLLFRFASVCVCAFFSLLLLCSYGWRRDSLVCRSNSNSIHLFSYFYLIGPKWRAGKKLDEEWKKSEFWVEKRPKRRCLFYWFSCSLARSVSRHLSRSRMRVDHDARNQKLSLDIVGHKIIVRFSWFIAFSVAALISFYYFHWFIQFSISLVWLSYARSLTPPVLSPCTVCIVCFSSQSGWNVRPCVVDGCVAMFVDFYPLKMSHPWFCYIIYVWDLKWIVMNVNKAIVEHHNSISMRVERQRDKRTKSERERENGGEKEWNGIEHKLNVQDVWKTFQMSYLVCFFI